jgi:hypothetical protein
MLRKKEYYKIETVRLLLYPIFLVLVAIFFISQGWVTPEQAGIVWAVIIIQTLASLLAIGAYYFLEK